VSLLGYRPVATGLATPLAHLESVLPTEVLRLLREQIEDAATGEQT
jgi:hypothetical protein